MSDVTFDCEDVAEGIPANCAPTPLEVSASVKIEAEPSRVLYALAIPEYMEAWLQFPEAERVECRPELRSYDRFRIKLICTGGRQRTIHGSCLLSKPNRITYLWERDNADDRPTSMVEIRLWGGPSQCTLKLRHNGFCNQDEREWHSRMWSCSLKNLCRLMEGIGSAPEDVNSGVARGRIT
jgi:uncharacterized protein YndB with AHSA1/START domain